MFRTPGIAGFGDECRRQSRLLVHDRIEPDVVRFLENAADP
ncbi:antitoxin MazE-like protein [Pelodictyon luteolum]